MEILCVPSGVISIAHPAQGTCDLMTAGFDNILLDLAAFCPPGVLENFGKEKEDQEGTKKAGQRSISEYASELGTRTGPLLKQYRKAGLHTPAARAPYLSRNTKRQDLNDLLFCLAYESIRICKEAGCRTVVIRPLFSGLARGEEWKVNREFYRKLLPAAKEAHVMILLENQCREINGHLIRGICSDPEDAAAWVDRLNEEAGEVCFGFCMDIGSCNLCGQNMQEFARVLGDRIKAVILRDNDGQREMSAIPFTCTVPGGEDSTDWLSLIRGLRKTEFDGQLILDFADTAGSFSPLLRPPLLKLARATGEYFSWQIRMEKFLKQYQSIVLFGAGNMCRNYMKCYGEMYPPLFTCDNDRRLWGSRFCGLEVRPPEDLKELSEDCAVLICNIYYREIEQQLRDMGIAGQIGFFNDEYMPSFYFDRLEWR